MRNYEVTIILKADLEDSARDELIERVTGWLTQEGDNTPEPKIDHWGRRSLAYPIRDRRDGYYVYYEVQLEPERMNAVERDILYQDDILRHLVVRKDD